MSEEIKIDRWDESIDGTLTEENMVKKLASQGYTCTRYVFSPGTVFPDHTHGYSKKDAIVSGQFRFSMYGQNVVLGAGDMMEVPKGAVHNASVVGTNDVVFLDASKR